MSAERKPCHCIPGRCDLADANRDGRYCKIAEHDANAEKARAFDWIEKELKGDPTWPLVLVNVMESCPRGGTMLVVGACNDKAVAEDTGAIIAPTLLDAVTKAMEGK